MSQMDYGNTPVYGPQRPQRPPEDVAADLRARPGNGGTSERHEAADTIDSLTERVERAEVLVHEYGAVLGDIAYAEPLTAEEMRKLARSILSPRTTLSPEQDPHPSLPGDA